MLKALRPNPQVLVVSEQRLRALIRLGIWIGVVSVFYLSAGLWFQGIQLARPPG
jgi:hypothetical protein